MVTETRPIYERRDWPEGTQLVDVQCICPVCGVLFEVEMTVGGAAKVDRDLGKTEGRFRWTCGHHSLADVHAMVHGRNL